MTTVKLDDAPDYFRNLSPRLQKAALEGLYMAGMLGVREIVIKIIPSRNPQPVDRGTYRAGWGPASVTKLGNTVVLQNKEPQAAFIEYGVRAENVKIGRAMIQALKEWALRKAIAKDEAEATSMAWAIARNMQKTGVFNRRGKKGLGILAELMDKRMPKLISQEVNAAIQRELKRG